MLGDLVRVSRAGKLERAGWALRHPKRAKRLLEVRRSVRDRTPELLVVGALLVLAPLAIAAALRGDRRP